MLEAMLPFGERPLGPWNFRICMRVCMHVCMYLWIYVCMYACMHACMFACTYIHTYIHTYVLCGRTLTYISTSISPSLSLYIYIYIYICIYIYIYIHICITIYLYLSVCLFYLYTIFYRYATTIISYVCKLCIIAGIQLGPLVPCFFCIFGMYPRTCMFFYVSYVIYYTLNPKP